MVFRITRHEQEAEKRRFCLLISRSILRFCGCPLFLCPGILIAEQQTQHSLSSDPNACPFSPDPLDDGVTCLCVDRIESHAGTEEPRLQIISHLRLNLIQAKQLLALTFSRYVRVLRLSASFSSDVS